MKTFRSFDRATRQIKIILQAPQDSISHKAAFSLDMEEASDAPSSSTVRFNVGGCIYEISKQLMAKYRHKMLASISSDRWLEDPKASVFIEISILFGLHALWSCLSARNYIEGSTHGGSGLLRVLGRERGRH